jgi:hypothetical protein
MEKKRQCEKQGKIKGDQDIHKESERERETWKKESERNM